MTTTRPDPVRRRLLHAAGGLAALGLAGCIGAQQPSDGGGAQSPTPDPTPEPSDDGHADDDHHEPEVHHEEEETHAEGEGHGEEGPQPHVEVAMQSTSTGHHFHPHVAWVEVGGTVTFVNESGAHTATAYHPDNGKPLRMPEAAEPFDSGLLTEAGATFEHTFDVEGVYDVYCIPHEEVGMIGSVVVGRPDPHGQHGLAEPQSGMSETVAAKIGTLNDQVNTMLGHEH